MPLIGHCVVEINKHVGADSLVVSATRVRFTSLGPLLIPPPSLHPLLSCLHSTVLSNNKRHKISQIYIYIFKKKEINNHVCDWLLCSPLQKCIVKSFDAFQSRRADTLDCLPNLFHNAIITKKTDTRPGIMGSFSI